MNTFIGRENELAKVVDRLTAGARLITVLGIGGIGKTRFAAEVAHRWLTADPNRTARKVDLSAVRSSEDVVLLLEPLAEESLDLVVLDNFEQLLPECAGLLPPWLEAVPNTRVLVTSRAPLRLSMEERVELPTLSSEEGRRLFEETVERLGAPLATTERSAAAEITQRLDGIPLAIELVAARAPILGAAQILERLSLALMNRGAVDRPRRQATMESTIEWSWALLNETERTVLSQSTVFAGSFTLEAAEAVLGRDALDTLQSLREHSLLRCEDARGPGGRRLRHFEVVRAFARDRLDDAERLERLHADYYVALAEREAERLAGPEGEAAQATLGVEMENLSAAEHRFRDSDPETAARILVALHVLFTLRGPFEAFLTSISRGVDLAEKSGRADIASKAHIARAEALVFRRRQAEAGEDLERALELAESAGSIELKAHAYRWMGVSAREDGRDVDAERLLRKAMAASMESGNVLLEARCASHLGTLRRFQLRDDEAQSYYEHALEKHRSIGNAHGEMVILGNIGHLHAASGRLESAEEAYREALIRRPGSIDRRSEAIVLAHLGGVEARLGRLEEAEQHIRRALTTFEELLDGPMEALTRAQLGTIDASRGRIEDAEDWFAKTPALVAPESGWSKACQVLHGLVDVARAAHASERGRVEEAQRCIDRAELALREARDAMEVGAVHSDHVRQAVERLQAALLDGRPETNTRKTSLTIAADGTWFALDTEEPIDLSRRAPLARVLRHLLDRRLAAPHEIVKVQDLIEQGWHGEVVLPEAGKTRVYSAIAALRRFGLKEAVLTREGGYLLDPSLPVTRV